MRRTGEADHVGELLAVAALAPQVVVPVLLAPGRVDPRGLNVAIRMRADPDVLPSGRDAQLRDPFEQLSVLDLPALVGEVLEALAAATATDSGPRAVDFA